MNRIKALCFWCYRLTVRLAVSVLLTWTLLYLAKVFLPFPVPRIKIFMLCYAYSLQIEVPSRMPWHKNKAPKSAPKCFHLQLQDGLTQVNRDVDKVEELLQGYGSLVEESGVVYRDTFRQIYKEQRQHLRRYDDFTKQHAEQFGSIINVLEAHRKDITESSRAAAEQNASICGIIGQHRQIAEDNKKLIQNHMDSVAKALEAQDKAIARNQELVDKGNGSVQNTLHNHTQLIEGNTKLIRGHGSSIDKVVSDQEKLCAEYQKALDGLALLITANRIFSSMQGASEWENLGDHARGADAKNDPAAGTQEMAQEHGKLVGGPGLGVVASASVVDAAQQMVSIFRVPGDEKARPTDKRPEGVGQRAGLAGRENNKAKKAEYPGWQPASRTDQLMATVFDQLRATLQGAVEARCADEMRQLRQGHEDLRRLRAEVGDVQEMRQAAREYQALRERLDKIERENALLEERVQRAQRDEALREQVRLLVREEVSQRSADADTITITTATNATTNLAASTDDETVTPASMTDPTEVTYHGRVPTAASKDDDAAGDRGASDDVEGDDDHGDGSGSGACDYDGDGRLLGDSLGRTMAREDWPDKKKPRRKTRKMYAMAKQRAERQREE